MTTYISIWPVLALALIHFFGNRLNFLSGVPRNIWLSMAGGVSVAFVFLHLFPELNEGQAHVEDDLPGEAYLRHHVYIVALVGLSVFYGLEKAATKSRQERSREEGKNEPSTGIFWIHIGSFALYNALIGYLLFTREEGPLTQLLLFSIAMALHFLVNDFGLYVHHHVRYATRGRWILVAALVMGWATGFFIKLSHTLIVLILAFVGGGIVLNVLKEELPEERDSRFWAFLAGALAYSILLLTIQE
jgi:hypothetical protein